MPYKTFDKTTKNYDNHRPNYHTNLFKRIINYSNLSKNSRCIEIGCGTGQATRPFLDFGCSVKAVEIGENLSKFVDKKYKDYNNFEVENVAFEDYDSEDNIADLVFSATAFHWIPEEFGYNKVNRILKVGGTIALFWNRPFVSRVDDLLHKEIEQIYIKYIKLGYFQNNKKQIEDDFERYERLKNTMIEYGFEDVEYSIYKSQRRLSANDYIDLLNTYSDHISMDSISKIKFEEEIRRAVNNHGGFINIYDTMDLYLGKKSLSGSGVDTRTLI